MASEYTDPANLPVFMNILRQLRDIAYVSTIIFGLDKATEQEAFILRDLIRASNIKNHLIQWNDGPGFSGIYNTLNEAGFSMSRTWQREEYVPEFRDRHCIGRWIHRFDRCRYPDFQTNSTWTGSFIRLLS